MLRFGGEVVPLVRVGLQVVELLSILSVSDEAPVAIDDRILSGLHVGEEHIAILGLGGILQRPGD